MAERFRRVAVDGEIVGNSDAAARGREQQAKQKYADLATPAAGRSISIPVHRTPSRL